MLKIENLSTHFPTERGLVKAVNNVSLSLGRGEILGLVGESGCGKSMTLLSILRLVPFPGKIVGGKIIFNGSDILQKSPAEMRRIRGKEIAMIFQDPMTTLNPVFKVGEQIGEALRIHGLMEEKAFRLKYGSNKRHAEKKRVLELMEEVGIPSPEVRYQEYPHQFSGGMQQRALIAIALSCNPKLLLADEPTTALDVTIQAQILALLEQINREHGTSIILVTHDLGVAAEFCHRIAVMYAGILVEEGPTEAVIERPCHPYTRGLLRSIPRITGERKRIEPIPGNVPDLAGLGEGCPFAPRCHLARAACRRNDIPWQQIAANHKVRCLNVT
ncbi:MAG TPA: ABC transporter ATP-binding protein [Firmicutes bacterium]|nr:ABC transporter ATP-binding protein [Bacillota bacterium]